MKNILKYLLPLVVLFSLSAMPIRAEIVGKTRLNALIREARGEENVEVVDIGSLGMKMILAFAGASAKTPEERQAVQFLKGIKSIQVVDFEEMEDGAKRRFAARLEKALAGREKLMEAKDDGESVRIYATLDEKDESLRDVVVFEGTGTLICLYGKVPLDMIDKMMEDYQ